MNQYCVVVVNGARARFFTLEPPQVPEMESGPNLVELTSLTNPERELQNRDLWSENKTGRNRGPGGGPGHGYDDHRDQHNDEYERRFANSIAEHASKLSHRCKASELVLVSQKRMLGFLRTAIESKLNGSIKKQELAKDLSKLSPLELHEHLAREQLVPPRRTPAAP